MRMASYLSLTIVNWVNDDNRVLCRVMQGDHFLFQAPAGGFNPTGPYLNPAGQI